MTCPVCGYRMLHAFDLSAGYYWFCFPCGLWCNRYDYQRGGGVVCA